MNNTILYGTSSSGKSKIWKASSSLIPSDKGCCTITVTWGYEDGKLQTKEIYVTSGKNIGKKNETTVIQQTVSELETLYNKQFDKGYRVDKTQNVTLRPMLAHKFKDKKHLIKLKEDGITFAEPWFIQNKLNGIRCLVTKTDENTIQFLSRTGKEFKPFVYLQKELLPLLEVGQVIDGELFNKDLPFEIIASIVNSKDERNYVLEGKILHTEKDIQYHVYDTGHSTQTFQERSDSLLGLLDNTEFVVTVPTYQVDSFEKISLAFDQAISDGYEGLMLRKGDSLYKYNYRSPDLLKYKEMEQSEFEILDIYLATNDPTKVQILCKNSFSTEVGYDTFDVGSVLGNKQDNLRKYYDNKDKLIGQYLTVNYQALSKYNVPLFPVGVDLRPMVVLQDGSVVPGV